MAKRTATKELTDRNWDEDDEPEEAGEFLQAATDVIQKRQIIKARRRNPGENESGNSAFKAFSGFGAKPPTNTLSSSSSSDASNNSSSSAKFSFAPKNGQSHSTESSKTLANGGSTSTEKSQYLQGLRNLNESVLKWITSHVEKNAYCILSPIFKDYEKHLGILEKEKQKAGDNKEEPKTITEKETTKKIEKEESEKPTAMSAFKFTTSTTSSTSSSNNLFSGFSFNTSSANADQPKPTFSFGSIKPSTTESTTSNATSENASQDEDEYVPPVVEATNVVEDGAIHTIRCKLFYNEVGEWKQKGVGNLNLKPCDNGKNQLIIRADTSLGNILLNVVLTSTMPVKREGKNNVSFACVPHPPIGKDTSKVYMMLIRVKGEDDADELLKKIEECKK